MSSQVQADDVVAARELIRDVISPTPVLRSRALSELVGGPVFLKCENLQRTGSFKVRGAYLRIARLTDAERARGVVAASAGNHAQGVAFAAGLLDTKTTVFMPEGAPLPKIQATRDYGADVVLHGASVEDALAGAEEQAARTGSVLIHPFEHPDIVTGQGTLGFEIIEQCPQVRTVVVPVGGGGLAAGVAVAVKSLDPAVQIVGVQAAAVAPFPASLAAGRPIPVKGSATMADGIAVSRPGELTYGLLEQHGARVVTVTEESLSRGLLLCLERAKQVVEPAGAAGVAALLEHAAEMETAASWWCCPAATSIRCCCRSCSGTACGPPGVTSPSGAACRTGRVRWPRCCTSWQASGPTSWTSGTSALPPACRSARWRCCCRWKRGAPSTARK